MSYENLNNFVGEVTNSHFITSDKMRKKAFQ